MMQLRILILTNRVPYPLHDGGALAMDALIRGYHQAGMQVSLLAMNTTRHVVNEDALASLYPELDGFDTVPVNNDVKPLKVAQNFFFSKEPEHAARFYHPAFAEKLARVLQDFKPEIVQFESPFLSSYLPLIKDAKTVLRVHNAEYQIWERLATEQQGIKGSYLKVLAKRMRIYEEQIWGKFDLLLPITSVDAVLISKVHPAQQMLVAPYGTSAGPALQVPPSFTKAYHIAAMDWLPNATAIDWLLKDIWPGIMAVVPEAEFYFGGRNMPPRFAYNLPEGTHCAGELADVQQFIKDKQVLIVPLRSGGGIRVKILEAMAAGKLVISTTTGMQGIEAVAGIHYLEANKPDEFAQAFLVANTDKNATAAILKSAHQLIIDHYSNAAITGSILKRFGQLIIPGV